MTNPDVLNNKVDFKSDFGAFFSRGSTYFLNPYPVANLFHFGIDVTFFDLTYSKFKGKESYTYEDSDGVLITEKDIIDLHKAEVGLQVGPSVHVKPISGLGASVYARFAPSYSLMYENEDFSSGFAPLFTSGVTVGYKFIGVGVETRWGNTKHSFSMEDSDEGGETSVKQKFDIKGSRIFLAFRF